MDSPACLYSSTNRWDLNQIKKREESFDILAVFRFHRACRIIGDHAFVRLKDFSSLLPLPKQFRLFIITFPRIISYLLSDQLRLAGNCKPIVLHAGSFVEASGKRLRVDFSLMNCQSISCPVYADMRPITDVKNKSFMHTSKEMFAGQILNGHQRLSRMRSEGIHPR